MRDPKHKRGSQALPKTGEENSSLGMVLGALATATGLGFLDNTTTKICTAFDSDYMDVTIHNYVNGEEHDAKLLFGGDVTGEYWINIETGEVENLADEE